MLTAPAGPAADILPDLLAAGLLLVFCGTAASEVSARAGAYYANPTNRFWATLQSTGLTPRLFAPVDFRELLALKIGLTDLAKGAVGVDRQLRRSDFDAAALRGKIDRFQPQLLAFTSKTAWRHWQGGPAAPPVAYGWQAGQRGRTRFFVLPSPSGAARRYWDSAPWQALAAEYQRLRGLG